MEGNEVQEPRGGQRSREGSATPYASETLERGPRNGFAAARAKRRKGDRAKARLSRGAEVPGEEQVQGRHGQGRRLTASLLQRTRAGSKARKARVTGDRGFGRGPAHGTPGGLRSAERRNGSAGGETSEGQKPKSAAPVKQTGRGVGLLETVRWVRNPGGGTVRERESRTAKGVPGAEGAGRHGTPRKRSRRSGRDQASPEQHSGTEPRPERGDCRLSISGRQQPRQGRP